MNPSNPGKLVDYIANPAMIQSFKDQFSPYVSYGLDWSRPFNGTLFRLPLRTEKQSGTSLLSKKRVSTEDAQSLLTSLAAEASSMLLFLKHVEEIEIKSWESSAREPEVAFSSALTEVTAELRTQRAFIGGITAAYGAHSAQNKSNVAPVVADYTLHISCNSPQRGLAYEEVWAVCNQMGGRRADEIAYDPANAMLRLLPWGGVAACVSSMEALGTHGDNELLTKYGGVAYCFLPLPVRTGLPVMVNGFFELSSNRRDLWQGSADMTGDGRTRAAWNTCLLSDVIAPSYIRLLLHLRYAMGFSLGFQALWPSPEVSAPWTNLSLTVLELCRNEKLLRLSTSQDTGAPHADGWTECYRVLLLPPLKMFDNDSTVAAQADVDMLVEFLLHASQPLVQCTSKLRDVLEATGVCPRIADPKTVRAILKQLATNSKNLTYMPPRQLCPFLLRYCVHGIPQGQPAEDLDGLPILPLRDGSVGVLRIFSTQQADVIANTVDMGFATSMAIGALLKCGFNQDAAMDVLTTNGNFDETMPPLLVMCRNDETATVFEGASKIILDERDVQGPLTYFSHPMLQRQSNLRLFSSSVIIDLLRRILPLTCFAGRPLLLTDIELETRDNLFTFLSKFWAYASIRPEAISAVAEGAALIPSEDGYLLPLSRLSSILVPRSQRHAPLASDLLLSCLVSAGAHIANLAVVATFETNSMPRIFWNYVHDTSRNSVLTLLDTLIRQKSLLKLIPFTDVTNQQRDELRRYLCTCETLSSLSGTISQRFRLF